MARKDALDSMKENAAAFTDTVVEKLHTVVSPIAIQVMARALHHLKNDLISQSVITTVGLHTATNSVLAISVGIAVAKVVNVVKQMSTATSTIVYWITDLVTQMERIGNAVRITTRIVLPFMPDLVAIIWVSVEPQLLTAPLNNVILLGEGATQQ
jgi:hypothetical protein